MASDQAPNRIAEVRRARKLTQQAVADLLGIHWITVSKLERGRMKLTVEWAQRLASVLNVPVFDLYARTDQATNVFPVGVIGSKGDLILRNNCEPGTLPDEVLITLGTAQTANNAWVMVSNDEMRPFLHPGDLIHVNFLPKDARPSEYLDRLVLAFTKAPDVPDGLHGTFGTLSRGSAPDLYDIKPFGSAPHQDIKIASLCIVTLIVVRSMQPQ